MMLNENLRNRASHRKVFGLAIAGTIAGATLATFSPAAAQQAKTGATPVTANTDCRTYRDPGVILEASKCEVLKGRALDAQSKALDAQAAKEKEVSTCLVKLVAFKKTAPEKFREFGTITRENACDVAGRIPKPTASAVPSVGG